MAEFSPRATLYSRILLIIMQCIYARRDYAEFNPDHHAPLFTPTTPNLRLRWNDKWKIKTNSGTAEIHWVVTGNGLKIPILMENSSGTRADCIGARHPMALDRLSCKISDSQSYVSLDLFDVYFSQCTLSKITLLKKFISISLSFGNGWNRSRYTEVLDEGIKLSNGLKNCCKILPEDKWVCDVMLTLGSWQNYLNQLRGNYLHWHCCCLWWRDKIIRQLICKVIDVELQTKLPW